MIISLCGLYCDCFHLYQNMKYEMGGKRIKLDLNDFLESIGCHRWMFLSDDLFATVGDLVE